MARVKTSANQKVVFTHKQELVDGHFMTVNDEEWMAAFANLNKNAFGIYLRLVKNNPNLEKGWRLSPKAFENEMGMNRNTYKSAITELKKKGYLVERKNNLFDFYSIPVDVSAEKPEVKVGDVSPIQNEDASDVDAMGDVSPDLDEEWVMAHPSMGDVSTTNRNSNRNNNINSFPASQRGSLAAAATQGDSFAAQTGEDKNEWEAEEAKEYIYRSKRDIEILSKDSLVDRLSEDSNNTKEEVTKQLKSWDVDLKQLEEYMQTNPYIDKADYWGNLRREYNDWHDRAVFVTDGWLADILSVYEAS